MTTVPPEYGRAQGDPYSDPYGQDPYRDAYALPYGDRTTEQHTGQHGEQPYAEPYPAQQAQQAEAYAEPYAEPYTEPQAAGPGSHGQKPGSYEAAVDALTDPLTDPLPGQRPAAVPGEGNAAGDPAAHSSPWFPTPHEQRLPHQTQEPQQPQPQPPQPRPRPAPAPAPEGEARQQAEWTAPAAQRPAGPATPSPLTETVALPVLEPDVAAPRPDRTERNRTDRTDRPNGRAGGPGSPRGAAAEKEDEDRTVGLRRPDEAALGGRAARRKAAQRRGGSRARTTPSGPAPRPGTRLEARRAARAAKDGPAVLLSRFIGELFITLGVLMLLFVGYQLWWTNVLADRSAGGAANDLAEKWGNDPERRPGKFSAGQGFAIMYIPKLDIRVPVAEGIDKKSVLDKGMVGHYDAESGLDTAMPWDKKGNFSVAGHRNTHGEPFRYINRLVAGDEIIVETADTYYVYEMYSRLPSTLPSNVSVVEPVPPQSGFEKPGRYVTLTTCTPEFTSKYRLIVWGKMVEERPRSKGKPDALVE